MRRVLVRGRSRRRTGRRWREPPTASWRPGDLKLGDVMSSMWVNFARTGSPDSSGFPHWPAYDSKLDVLMNFGDTPKAESAPNRAQIEFIDAWQAQQRSRR